MDQEDVRVCDHCGLRIEPGEQYVQTDWDGTILHIGCMTMTPDEAQDQGITGWTIRREKAGEMKQSILGGVVGAALVLILVVGFLSFTGSGAWGQATDEVGTSATERDQRKVPDQEWWEELEEKEKAKNRCSQTWDSDKPFDICIP